MVGLVLQRPGEQLRAAHLDRFAVHRHAARDDGERPPRVEGELGDRQAALVAVLRLVGQVEDRVDQVADLIVDPPGEDTQTYTDLRGGEPAPRGVLHGVDEIAHERLEFLVEVLDGSSGRAQHRVTEESDGSHCHGEQSTRALRGRDPCALRPVPHRAHSK
jgi:hypothetical protein